MKAKSQPVVRAIKACGIAGLLVLVSGNASAAGFALIEQSISGMGTAYAIGSAGIDDASTIFFNPAGMSRLPGSMITGNLQIVNANTNVECNGLLQPEECCNYAGILPAGKIGLG